MHSHDITLCSKVCLQIFLALLGDVHHDMVNPPNDLEHLIDILFVTL